MSTNSSFNRGSPTKFNRDQYYLSNHLKKILQVTLTPNCDSGYFYIPNTFSDNVDSNKNVFLIFPEHVNELILARLQTFSEGGAPLPVVPNLHHQQVQDSSLKNIGLLGYLAYCYSRNEDELGRNPKCEKNPDYKRAYEEVKQVVSNFSVTYLLCPESLCSSTAVMMDSMDEEKSSNSSSLLYKSILRLLSETAEVGKPPLAYWTSICKGLDEQEELGNFLHNLFEPLFVDSLIPPPSAGVNSSFLSLMAPPMGKERYTLHDIVTGTNPLNPLNLYNILCLAYKACIKSLVTYTCTAKSFSFLLPPPPPPLSPATTTNGLGAYSLRNSSSLNPNGGIETGQNVYNGSTVEKNTILGRLLGLGYPHIDRTIQEEFKDIRRRPMKETEDKLASFRGHVDRHYGQLLILFNSLLRGGPLPLQPGLSSTVERVVPRDCRSLTMEWVCTALAYNKEAL